jgi:hypothetical protein
MLAMVLPGGDWTEVRFPELATAASMLVEDGNPVTCGGSAFTSAAHQPTKEFDSQIYSWIEWFELATFQGGQNGAEEAADQRELLNFSWLWVVIMLSSARQTSCWEGCN